MASEAILIEHSVGQGFLDLVVGGRRTSLCEDTNRLRGDLVDAAISLLPRNIPDRVIFLVVDESITRGECDQFVRLLQNGKRPPLPKGFSCVCGDDRLTEYPSE